jgi:hypothetical protein
MRCVAAKFNLRRAIDAKLGAVQVEKVTHEACPGNSWFDYVVSMLDGRRQQVG